MKRNLESRGGDAGCSIRRCATRPVHPGQPDQRPQEPGNAPGRQLRPAPAAARSRGDRLPAGPDRRGRTALLSRPAGCASASRARSRAASPRRRSDAPRRTPSGPHQRSASASSMGAAPRRSRRAFARIQARQQGAHHAGAVDDARQRQRDRPYALHVLGQHRDRERRVLVAAIDWTIRVRPPAMPYQVAPLPSMMR